MHPSPLSRRQFLTLSAGAAALAGFGPPLAGACPVIDPPDPLKTVKGLAAGINAFASDLHTRLAEDAKGDLFFSPFSIEAALAMTSAGARGTTLEEMEEVLRLPKDPHPAFGALFNHLNATGRDRERGYELSVANAIWAQKDYPWNTEFADLTQKHYGAGLVPANFAAPEAARERINAWAEKGTNGKIKGLIGPGVITGLTRMVLANAIYFKGTWSHAFDKKQTKDAKFTRGDGTTADVPLMSLTGEFNCGKSHFGGRPVEVLELPYAGKEVSMLVFLPEKGREFERFVSAPDGGALAAPQLAPTEVKVFLPRFKAESALSLKPVLMDMGMKSAFTAADFTGMSPRGKELFVSHVLHKAFVDVNEEGTEAAAATAVVIAKESASPQPTVFRADRPFVFAIRDNATGAVLFMGRYAGPTK